MKWISCLATFAILAVSGIPVARAESSRPKLRWGADLESGAPFSYKDPSNPKHTIGFEAEIVEAIAQDLGMEVELVQNDWDGLVEGLKRGDYDVIVNGLEITPERAKAVGFSRPYYVTSETLTVRREDDRIIKLEDAKGLRVGTLEASLAHKILVQAGFTREMIVPYGEEVLAYGDLALKRIDAVLLDEPIALYYAAPNRELKSVGGPIGRMEYGVATRLQDRELREKIDASLTKMIESGRLKTILESWNLWNVLTAKEWNLDPSSRTKPVAYEKFLETAYAKPDWKTRLENYVSFLPLLAKGAVMTVQISVLSMMLAIVIGILVAMMNLYGPAPVRWGAIAFVEVWRGTPLLIQLFLIFYGLPHLGLKFDPFVAAVLGLGLNYGACEAENYRAGILSIPKSQMDASQALGMSWWQSHRYIILPQAVRVVIPPVTNDFIALLKDSSLVSVISMVELTTVYGQLASTYFDYLGIGLLTAAIYFLIGLPFVRLSRYLESHARPWEKPIRGASKK